MHISVKMIGLAALIGAVPSSAGELTGTGSPTPVDSYQANSICSFSGLNDDAAPTPDRVQSYGMIVRALGGHLPFGPWDECKGN